MFNGPSAMSWISLICAGISFAIILSAIRREADLLSPSRIFGFTWSLSIALADLKMSGLQSEWSLESWVLLLTGIAAFLVGTFGAYVLNLERILVPISVMRGMLRREEVRERRLFLSICLAVGLYGVTYLASFLVKGFLPISVVGTKITRVDFNVYGWGIFINSTAFIIFFTVLYHLIVEGKKAKKMFLTGIALVAVGSYLLLLQRFQIVMAAVVCFTLLYYATPYIRLRTVVVMAGIVTAFFYWITSLRYRHVELLTMFLYSMSKMKFSTSLAIFTEPYMYVVMNLENFARATGRLDHYTFGYFSFDFIPAITGLKYWISDYFNVDRTPYLISGYNTYTAFWSFYRDFGVIGLALIPLLLGFSVATFYYRMRGNPTIANVTGYGIAVFIMLISFFTFPIAYLWFEYNLLVFYLILRWTMMPRTSAIR